MSTPARSMRALLTGLIDYAGLFPPATLSMQQSVENYAKYLESERAWMLGRFICPVSKLAEFERFAGPHLPRRALDDTPPWQVSAIVDGDLSENLDAVFAFNAGHAEGERGLAVIDAVEIRLPADVKADTIEAMIDKVPDDIYPFFEIAVDGAGRGGDFRGQIAALAGAGAGAKLRTGGVKAEMFPACEAIAPFIAACDAADVPFKATAGLHHPIRAEYNLTYEPNCPRGLMHGFLNVFVAACFVRAAVVPPHEIVEVLAETDPTRFRFDEASISWRNRQLDTTEVEEIRDTFALSYGSCSFDEPADDLKKLGLL